MKTILADTSAAAVMAAFLLLASVTFPNEVRAEQCSPVESVVTHLSQRFKEQVVARGVSGNETLIMIFASSEGSWTIAEVNTSGLACLRAAGQGFESSLKGLDGPRHDDGKTS